MSCKLNFKKGDKGDNECSNREDMTYVKIDAI